jgi:hypothetical protein
MPGRRMPWRARVGLLAGGLVLTATVAALASYPELLRDPTLARFREVRCIRAAQEYARTQDRLMAAFDDEMKIALRTPRIALAERLSRLEAIKRELEETDVPECAVVSDGRPESKELHGLPGQGLTMRVVRSQATTFMGSEMSQLYVFVEGREANPLVAHALKEWSDVDKPKREELMRTYRRILDGR